MGIEQTGGRLTRRGALRLAGAGSAVALGGLSLARGGSASVRAFQDAPEGYEGDGPFSQAALPYSLDALESSISAETMELHFGTLHVNYVKDLNALVADQSDLEGMNPGELIQNLGSVATDKVANLNGVVKPRRSLVRFNAGGHFNHTFFWSNMSPDGGGEPSGDVAQAIDDAFGDFASMQEAFKLAGLGVVGSGWVWLVANDGGEIALTTTPGQDNPLMDSGRTPILGIDVWEHAYLLQYGGKRGDYITAWWDVVNWDNVAERFDEAVG